MKKINYTIITLLLGINIIKAQNTTRMTCYYDVNDKKSYYIVWDIKTGKSVQYYWNNNEHKWSAFEINLPAQPIANLLGNVMIDVYYDHKDGAAYYIAWDTKTGRSVQYYWDGKNNKWNAFEINLPENPLPDHTGDVMIKNYYATDDLKAYYIVYDTNGGKSLQYYWNGTDRKWDVFDINLPEKPLMN